MERCAFYSEVKKPDSKELSQEYKRRGFTHTCTYKDWLFNGDLRCKGKKEECDLVIEGIIDFPLD